MAAGRSPLSIRGFKMIGDVMKGFTGSFTSGKAIGSILAVIVVLALLHAFWEDATPAAIGARVKAGA